MNTCATCRHWTQLDEAGRQYGPLEAPSDPTKTWTARRIERNKDFGTCEGVPFFDDVPTDADVPLAVVVDGSGYQGALMTTSRFGCVLHEPRA